MPKFQKYLRHIDMLVTPYEFNVTKSQKSLTKLGGFFSIAILILMIVYTISIFISTMAKAGSIYAGTQTYSEIESLDQNSSLFILQLSYAYSGEIITYNSKIASYFSFSAQYIDQVRPENSTQYTRNYHNLTQQNCTKEIIEKFNFTNTQVLQEQTDKYICFSGNYKLSGSFFDPAYNYLKISVNKCEDDISCDTNEELLNFINKGVNVNIFILDSKIKQTLNMTEPSQESAYTIYWRLTTGIANSEDIYLQPIIVDLMKNQNIFNSLRGDIDTRSRIFSSSRVEKSERRQYPFDITTDENLCTFYLRTSSDSQYFFAQKTEAFSVFLDAVSQAAGLAVAILGVIKILYKIYIEHETYIQVMNQVFKFDLREASVVKGNHTIKESFNTDKQKRLDQIYENQLKYSFCSFFCIKTIKFLSSCKLGRRFFKGDHNQDQIMAQMAKSKIMSDLELSNIVQKLYEIDCLKLLLFDDDQLKLFNSFSQPVFQKNMVEQIDLLRQVSKEYKRSNLKGASLERFQLKNPGGQNINMDEAFSSSIPIELRLQKVSRFFKAQIKAQSGDELLQAYSKIQMGRNSNQQMNEQLLKFIKYNQTLYQIVDQNHRKWSSQNLDKSNEVPKLNKAKSQYLNYRLSHDMDFAVNEDGKISNDEMYSIQEISSKKEGYIIQNKGDVQIQLKDFDEIEDNPNNQIKITEFQKET